MSKLTGAERDKLPEDSFALPGRRYPIHDENHARDALARISQNGSPDEQRKVRAAVAYRYPNINVSK